MLSFQRMLSNKENDDLVRQLFTCMVILVRRNPQGVGFHLIQKAYQAFTETTDDLSVEDGESGDVSLH